MVFSSPYFVFLFLPLALAICLPCRGLLFRFAIVLVSVFFYYWSAGHDTFILIGIVVVNHLGAMALARRPLRDVFAALVVANLGVLFVFKYAGFFARNVDGLIGTHLQAVLGGIVLPAGVSFFVFQAISYLADVRRGDIPAQRNVITYASYQVFFPHLIAGPIVRYRDVIGDLVAPGLSAANFSCGVSRFAHGLLKKCLIADGVAPVADSVFALPSGEIDFQLGWLGATAYAIQIYFDFSGYSDMAIGMAQMYGIRFHENFDRPYASRSITEFWRRWHMTLSSWFRDYVYIPLGGNRGGSLATYRNLLIVFALTGFWHGAAWTFVLWGLYHGAFLVLERISLSAPLQSLQRPALRWLYCLPVVVFGWVVFRATSVGQSLEIWQAMLNPFAWLPFEIVAMRAGLSPYSMAALAGGAMIFLLPGRTSLGARLMTEPASPALRLLNLSYTSLALLVSSILILTSTYSPFLYFAF